MRKYPVIVSSQAKQSLQEIVSYINEDSPQAAEYVKNTLIALIRSLGMAPEKYSKEYLLENKGKNYRFVTKWRYKIVYLFTGKKVLVLDIIHTSMNPEEIKHIE